MGHSGGEGSALGSWPTSLRPPAGSLDSLAATAQDNPGLTEDPGGFSCQAPWPLLAQQTLPAPVTVINGALCAPGPSPRRPG